MSSGRLDLEATLNPSWFHRDAEKFYASSPREFDVRLQRHARTLQALADQWSTAEPSTRAALSPFEGATDLNSHVAMQLLDGALFTGREGEPAEIACLIRACAWVLTRAPGSARRRRRAARGHLPCEPVPLRSANGNPD